MKVDEEKIEVRTGDPEKTIDLISGAGEVSRRRISGKARGKFSLAGPETSRSGGF